MASVETAESLKIELDRYRPLDKELESKIFQKFRLDWSYHSNKIEGNSLTYGETKALILFGITAQGKPLKDHFELTGHDEAIKWILDIVNEERVIGEVFIKQLHTLLLRESYYVDAITPDGKPTRKKVEVGKYKSTPNHVRTKTGEIFRFAEPEETASKMADLIQWYRDCDLNPIVKAAEFHYRFILIHPFDDGNGRTARILMNFILLMAGYPPAIINTSDREEYFRVLRLADSGQLEPFIEFIANNVITSLNLMLRAARGESIEEQTDIDKEISLLKKKYLSSGSTVREMKSPELIKDLLSNGLGDFVDRFYSRIHIFDEFYVKIFDVITVNNKPYTYFGKEQFRSYINEFEEDIEFLSAVVHFSDLREINAARVEFQSALIFDFRNSHIEIKTRAGNAPIFKKYDEKLTIDEIDSIINQEMRAHKSFIEKRIV
ncbi:MAG: Fic family protein [Cyanobacteria bacterium J06649_11]